MKRIFTPHALIWLLFFMKSDAALASTYRIQRLGIDGQSSQAGALNELGDTVIFTLPGEVVGNGRSGFDLDPPGAVWKINSTGHTVELPGLGGPQDRVFAMNDSGVIAGSSNELFLQGTTEAVIWAEDNTVTRLPLLTGDSGTTQAIAINEMGQLLIHKESQGLLSSFLLSPGQDLTPLEPLTGVSNVASDINDLGQIVGGITQQLADESFVSMPYIWNSGVLQELGTLGGSRGTATAINNLGQVVGASETATGETHSFIWDVDSGIRDLGTLEGLASVPADVNDLGVIVGNLIEVQATTASIAFIFTEAGGMQILENLIPNDSGWTGPFVAVDINNRGQILGHAQLDGMAQAFLLSPIPEPSSFIMTLVIIGLVLSSSTTRREI